MEHNEKTKKLIEILNWHKEIFVKQFTCSLLLKTNPILAVSTSISNKLGTGKIYYFFNKKKGNIIKNTYLSARLEFRMFFE